MKQKLFSKNKAYKSLFASIAGDIKKKEILEAIKTIQKGLETLVDNFHDNQNTIDQLQKERKQQQRWATKALFNWLLDNQLIDKNGELQKISTNKSLSDISLSAELKDHLSPEGQQYLQDAIVRIVLSAKKDDKIISRD